MKLFTTCLYILFFLVARSQKSDVTAERILMRSSEKNLQSAIDSIGHIIGKLPIDKALPEIDKLLHLSVRLPHAAIAFRRLSEMGRGYYKNHFVSKQYLLYSLSILDDPTFGRPDIQKVILGDIGSLYYTIGDLDNAEFYLKKYLALQAYGETGDNINMYTTLGYIYLEKDNDSLAISYMQKALDLSIKVNHHAWIGLSHGNLGYALFTQGKYDNALPHLFVDIQISNEMKSYESAAGSYVCVGLVYLKKNELTKARPYLDSALFSLNKDEKATISSTARIKVYKAYADFYTKIGQYAKANDFLQMAWNIRDTVNLYKNSQGIVLQITEMNVLKEKQKVDLLKLTLGNKKRNETLFFICIGAALLVLAFVVLLLKQKLQLNKVLQEKNASVLEQKQAVEAREKQLADSNEAKTKLFSIIAHDLRAPVGNLQGLLSMMEDGVLDGEALKEHLPEISSKVSTLSTTIDNLLSWTYSQIEGIEANLAVLDLYTEVNSIVDLLLTASSDKHVSLINNVSRKSFITADRNHLETILRNLLSNAIKFSNKGGAVIISTEQEQGKTLLSIADNGVGMTKEKMENLFVKNDSKVSTMGTDGEKGTGLGLIICKELAAKNGANIWAEANEPNGTVFKVSFKH